MANRMQYFNYATVQRIANDLLKLGAKHLDAHVANEALTETCRHEGQVQTH